MSDKSELTGERASFWAKFDPLGVTVSINPFPGAVEYIRALPLPPAPPLADDVAGAVAQLAEHDYTMVVNGREVSLHDLIERLAAAREKMHRRAQKAEGLLMRMARFLNTLERWADKREVYWFRRYARAAARYVRSRTGVARDLAGDTDRMDRGQLKARAEKAEAEVARLTDHIERIAKQRLTTEIPDDDRDQGDIEDGYNLCILEARAALTAKGADHG